eukprot:9055203-Pyramimonas_sp.AAC.1
MPGLPGASQADRVLRSILQACQGFQKLEPSSVCMTFLLRVVDAIAFAQGSDVRDEPPSDALARFYVPLDPYGSVDEP